MAEATTVTYQVIWSGFGGYKTVAVKWGNAASADTLTLTGYATISTIRAIFFQGGISTASATSPAFTAGGSNQLIFNQTTIGSGFAVVMGF